jgi:uncharacterized phage-like protein YoqJ
MNKNTCCFTGHRNIPAGDYEFISNQLEGEIINLIKKDVIYFGAGGALGFDTIAALAVLKLKVKYPQIKLILVLPCKEQADKWSWDDKKLYNKILYKADKIKYTSEHYTRHCMFIRNRHLVDNSGYCICYLTQNTGGTAYTVSYAMQNNLKTINLAKEEIKNE